MPSCWLRNRRPAPFQIRAGMCGTYPKSRGVCLAVMSSVGAHLVYYLSGPEFSGLSWFCGGFGQCPWKIQPYIGFDRVIFCDSVFFGCIQWMNRFPLGSAQQTVFGIHCSPSHTRSVDDAVHDHCWKAIADVAANLHGHILPDACRNPGSATHFVFETFQRFLGSQEFASFAHFPGAFRCAK